MALALAMSKSPSAAARIDKARTQPERLVAILQGALQLADHGAGPATIVQRLDVLRVEPDRVVEILDRKAIGALAGINLSAPIKRVLIVGIVRKLCGQALDGRIVGQGYRRCSVILATALAAGPAAFGAAPARNEKSSASDDEIHGTCSLREARVTARRMRLSISSAIRSGTRISLSSSCTNRLRSLPLSESTDESAAEYITSVPFGAITGARPAEKLRKRRSNGLRLEASIRAILTPAPRLLISPSTVSRLMPSRRTSASVQICASIGIM